ncbi:MAG: AAA family ATPase [Gammaproteobacteria bacterium RIFCSPHIGHO2_12_FULL_45_12]|nr:MAG: AAA family ATPase [Gammaproteobacteria bacterium RIFCSPHIGHO2_12_FULL_45_12]
MYTEFFNLKTLPFSLTPNPNFFCHLRGHQEALNTLQICIGSGEGFIKIIGEVGTGKTLLCRKLLGSLDETYVTAYIPNPDLTPVELRKAFARELGLDPTTSQDQHELLTALYQHLMSLFTQGKKVVLIIDEAQALCDESLETIRLLTNLETESHKLLQVVLFGQSELDERLNKPKFRQFKQRISFSYQLPLLNREDLDIYLYHRLAVAGYAHGSLFTKKARHLLFRASRGIPRIVNILSHKCLLVAYGRGVRIIDHKAMRLAIKDTEIANATRLSVVGKRLIVIALLMAGLLVLKGSFSS